MEVVTSLQMQWIFSKITPNSLHWRRMFSTDGGTTWQLRKEMNVRRVWRREEETRMSRFKTFRSTIIAIVFAVVLFDSSIAASDLSKLNARGPAAEYADKLVLFGQFVGDWEFDLIEIRPDGSKVNAKGEWHFGWVLEGRAVQDVWIVHSLRPGGRATEYGTTIRFYDAKIDGWRVVWSGPVNGNMETFIARQVGNQIIMEGKSNRDGSPARWISSEVRLDRFIGRQ